MGTLTAYQTCRRLSHWNMIRSVGMLQHVCSLHSWKAVDGMIPPEHVLVRRGFQAWLVCHHDS
jgi:hypothetical protein